MGNPVKKGIGRRLAGRLAQVLLLAAGLLLPLFAFVTPAHAAAKTASASGPWSSNTTWGGSTPPVAGDTVTINSGVVVTVDGADACASIVINAPTVANGIVISGSNTLTVSGAITMNAPTAAVADTIDVGAGTLIAGSISIAGSATSGRNTVLTVGAGVITVSGNITFSGTAAQAQLTFTGAGTLNIAGALSTGGTLTPGTGTVNYNAAGIQTVGLYTYNNLTLSNTSAKTFPAGTTTVNGILSVEGTASATVTGTLSYGASATLQYKTSDTHTAGAEWPATLNATGGVIIANTAGSVALSAAKVLSANVPLAINTGATLSTGNFQVSLGGNFTNGGTFSSGSSAIVIAGTAATQNIDSFSTTGTVSMTKTAGIATLTGAMSAGALTINGIGGTLNLGTALTHTVSGTWTRTNGTLDGGSSTLNFAGTVSGTGGTFTPNAGTINFNSSGAQSVTALTYWGLTVSGGNTKTLAGTTTVNGPLLVDTSTTFATSTRTLTVAGLTTVNGTLTISSTTGTKAFADVTVNSGGLWSETVTNEPLTFSGTLQNDGTFTANTGVHTFSGGATHYFKGANAIAIPSVTITGVYENETTLTVSTALAGAGSLTQGTGANLNLGGSTTSAISITTFDPSATGNTVNYSRAGTQTLDIATYYNLTLSGSNAKTFPAGTTTVNGTLSMEGTATVTLTGTLTYGASATLQYNRSGAQASGAEWVSNFGQTGGSLIHFVGTGAVSMNSAEVVYAPITIDSGATLTTGTNYALNLRGDFSNSGTFTAGTSVVTFDGTGDQNLGGGSTTAFSTLTINKASGKVLLGHAENATTFNMTAGIFDPATYLLTATTGNLNGGTLRVGATAWAGNYSFTSTPAAGFTIEYYNANPTINAAITYQNLQFSGAGTAGASGTLTIQGDLTNTGGGTLNFGTNGVTLSGTVSTNSIAGFTTTGPVQMTKTAGTATFTGSVSGGALTINGAGGTLNLGSGLSHSFSGTWTRTAGTLDGGSGTLTLTGGLSGTGGTFTANAGTVNYGGSGAQNVAIVTYNNLTLSGSGAKTFQAGTTNVNGVLSIEGTATATVTGTLSYGANATLQYKGSGAQTTGAEFPATFAGTGGVIINNAAGVNLGGSAAITNGLTLTSGTFAVGANTLTLNGPAIGGTPSNLSTTSASSLVFGGSAASVSIPSSVTALNNLTIGNASGITLNSSITINGVLTLTSGVVTAGANTLSVAAAGSISGGGTSSYIYGSLKKSFNTGAGQSFTFHIGDASNYTPVVVASMNVTTGGTLTATTAASDHPNIATSPINSAKDVTRYWTLTAAGGLVVTTYDATVTFVNGDIDSGANALSFIMEKYSGSWSAPPGGVTAAANSTTGRGFTSFGDLCVGEQKGLSATLSVSPAAAYGSTSAQFTIVITNAGGAGSDSIHAASFTVPIGYTSIPTAGGSYTVTASSGKTWTVTGVPAGGSGPQTVTVTSSSLANDIANTEYVQIVFTCTTPASTGATTWTSSATGTSGGNYTPSSQTVTIKTVSASAVVSPSNADVSNATQFTVTLTNNGGTYADGIHSASFTVPAGYSGIPTSGGSYTVTASGGKTWTVTGVPGGASGPQTVTVAASSAPNDLANTEYVQVVFTATTPSSAGSTSWVTSVSGALAGSYSPAAQTVTVKAVSASAAVSPASVDNSQSQQFTVILTNNGGAGADSLHVGSFTVPAGFAGIPTSGGGYAVTATGGKTWTVTGVPAGASGPQTVTVTASTGGDDIANSEWVQIVFTCTAPSSAGSTSWVSSVTGTLGKSYVPSSQTVTVKLLAASLGVSPANVDNGQATQFTVVVTNTGGAGSDSLHGASFSIPSGYTAIPTSGGSYIITASGGKTWTVTGAPGGSSGPQTVTLGAAAGADDLANGQYVQVVFTCSTPASAGSTSWTSSTTGALGGGYNATTQTVTVKTLAASMSVAPSSASTSASTSFTVVITNSGGAGSDTVHSGSFTIPSGYSGIPTTGGSYTVTASGGKSWTATGLPAGGNGPQTVTVTATTAGDDIANTEWVQIVFTASTPSSSGATTWSASATGTLGGLYAPSSQAVTIKALSATASISPSGVYQSQSKQFTVILTNNGGAGSDNIHVASFTVPSGYTSIPTVAGSYTVTASSSKSWTVTSAPAGSSGPQTIAVTAATGGDDLANTEWVQVVFTCTTPASTGTTSWTFSVTGSLGATMTPGAQTVTVGSLSSTASVSPSSVDNVVSPSFTVVFTNNGGATGDTIHSASFVIPTGYSSIPTLISGYTVTASGGKTWTVTGVPAGPGGPKTVTVTASTAGDDIANTEWVQVVFACTTPSSAGSASWTFSVTGTLGGTYAPSSQTVSVQTLAGSTNVSPASVGISQPRQFTIVITNTSGPGGDSISVASFTVPTGYSAIPTSAGGYAVTASGSKNWTVTGVPGSANGPQTVTVSASTAGDYIANGENVQIVVTVTDPATAGLPTWSSSVRGALGGTKTPAGFRVVVFDILSVTTYGVDIAPVTLDGTDKTTTGTTSSPWLVSDYTGTGAGWHVTVSSTDFLKAGNPAITMPVSGFQIQLLNTNIATLYGNSQPTSTVTGYTTLDGTGITMASAAAGNGVGDYCFNPTFQLQVPASAYSGTYSATLTVTMVSGP